MKRINFTLFCWAISALAMLPLSAQIMVETITEEFDASGGLQMGADGLLYIANFGESLDNGTGNQVWQLDFTNGGQPTIFATGLNGASGNDFDSEGNLFQSNIAAGDVRKIDPNGTVTTFASNGISCNVGINIDSEDNLYVCNCCGTNGNTIRKVTPEGISTVFSSGPFFSCPNGITRDGQDNLYVSNFSNGNIVKITPEGQASLLATTPGIPGLSAASNGHIIYSAEEDVLYVASHGSHKIYQLTPDGTLTVIAGTGVRGNNDGPAGEATFSRPNGLALSMTEDTLFANSSIPVTDAGGRPLNPSVIRMITGLRNITNSVAPPEASLQLIHQREANQIIIKGLSEKNVRIKLIGVNGQILLTQQLDNILEETTLPLPDNISDGIYFVSILLANGQQQSKKILLTR